MSWEREKKLRADVEKVKRKVEGDLKVRILGFVETFFPHELELIDSLHF